MMDDFRAKILAELDLTKIPSQLKQIEKHKIELSNFALNTKLLPSQIQASLDNHKFQINLDGIKMGSIDSQMGAVGGKVGQSISKSVSNAAFKEYTRLQKEIGSIEIKLAKLDGGKNQAQITELLSQLTRLKGELQEVDSAFAGSFSDAQIQTILNGYDAIGRKVSEFKAKAEDSKRAIAEKVRIGIETGDFQSKVTAIERDLDKLGDSASDIVPDLERLKEALNTMSTSTDMDEVAEAYKTYGSLLPKISNQTKDLLAAQKLLTAEQKRSAKEQETLTKSATLSNRMEAWLKDNTKAAERYGAVIEELQNQLENNTDPAILKDVSLKFAEIQSEAKAAGLTTKTFGAQLKDIAKDALGLGSIAAIFQTVKQVLSEMYQVVYDIDTSMTELRKVTNETEGSYNSFLKNAGSSAKEIGTTIDAYINSTASFARLGHSFTDSQELAKVANLYTVVGDEIESAEVATQSIISTMAAFDIAASNSISIVDKFNKVGNEFAISSGGIGDALTRSASSFAAANNTLDESIALITAANTVVQNPESVGTAFKTISMRIRGAKTELEEAGLDTENMASSVATLRKEIKALSGVDIMIDDNTFKSTYAIMDELSGKWKDLSDIQQATITELLAGKRQGNIMSSLLNNFDIAREVLNSSMQSQGSAMAEHAKWMESLEAKTNQFRASYQNLATVVLNSNFLKGAIDSGRILLDVFTGIVDTIGVFGAGGIGIGIAAFVKNFD